MNNRRVLIGALAAVLLILVVSASDAGIASAATSPSGVSVTLTSTAAGVHDVRYDVLLTVSGSGALAQTTGTVTLAAPAGTVFFDKNNDGYDCGTYAVTTLSGPLQTSSCITFVISGGGATVAIQMPFAIAANQQVLVQANVVTNAAVGTKNLAVSTSSDTTSVNAPYTLVTPQQLADVSIVSTTTAAGAEAARYTVDFTPSSSGGLATNWSTITLDAPAGTVFSGTLAVGMRDFVCETYFMVNLDTNTTRSCLYFTRTNSGASVSVEMSALASDPMPGEHWRLIANGVTNAPNTGQTLSVRTSSDTVATVLPMNLESAHALESMHVTPSATDIDAINNRYTVDFTTSSTGGLAHEWSYITISAPEGTVFPGTAADGVTDYECSVYFVANITTNQLRTCFTFTRKDQGRTVSITLRGPEMDLAAGDVGRVQIYGVANGGEVGGQFIVSTSSDLLDAAQPASLSAPNSATAAAVQISDETPGASGVQYQFIFHTSDSGGLPQSTGTITLSAPAGTVFPPMNCNDYFVRNATEDRQRNCLSEVSRSNSGATITVQLGGANPHSSTGVPTDVNIGSGEWGMLTITNVISPSTAGTIYISTNADPLPIPVYRQKNLLISGTITHGGAPAGGAGVQACTAGVVCYSSVADGAGHYTVEAFPGVVGLKGIPGANLPFASPGYAGPINVANTDIAGVDIELGDSAELDPSVSITGASGVSTAGGHAVIFWTAPFTYAVNTCPWGVGSLSIGINDDFNGTYEVFTYPLVEVPWGSGHYEAAVAPIAPAHGPATFSHAILCVGPTAVVPKAGPTDGGTRVVIHGTGFAGATSVLFGTDPATRVDVVDDSTIVAVSPKGTGTVDIRVQLAGGLSAPSDLAKFTYLAVTGVSPPNGPGAGFTQVNVSGTGFDSVVGVLFGNKPAYFDIISDTQLTAWSPPGSGTVAVIVVSIGQSSQSSAGTFTYGANVATAPLGLDSPGPLQLTESVGRADDQPFVPSGNGYKDAPNILDQISDFLGRPIPDPSQPSPTPPTTGNGTTSTGTSSGLIDPNGWVVDQFGVPIAGATATLWRSDAPEGPLTLAPANPAIIWPAINPEITDTNGFFSWDVVGGWYQVRATATGCHEPGDAGDLIGQTLVLPVPPPQLGLFVRMECPGHVNPGPPPAPVISPQAGGMDGGTDVVITGSGLSAASMVKFGTQAVSFKILAPNMIRAIAPPHAVGSVDVTVLVGADLTPTGPDTTFTYLGPPAISSITSLPTAAGEVVTLSGSGFTGVGTVDFGAWRALVVIHVSDSQLLVVVPSGYGAVGVVASSTCVDGVVPAGATACGSSAGQAFVYRDVATCDGQFDAVDALAVLRAAAGLSGAPEATAPCTADVDGDGVITVRDALLARRYAAGLGP